MERLEPAVRVIAVSPGESATGGRIPRARFWNLKTAFNTLREHSMTDIAFQSQARLLVLLHAASAIVLVGSSTHHFLVAFGYLRGRYKVRLGRIYAAIVLCAYSATFLLGALAYPTYRYHVRGLYLDRHAHWASNLFDIKENFAALGFPLVVALFVLSRVMKPKEDRSMVVGYVVMAVLASAIVWFNVVSGILITMERGV
jgi:hypothetical protein